MIRNQKIKVYKWTPDDISSAITLRAISPKAYRYLRKQKNFPLPGKKILIKFNYYINILLKYIYI